MSRSPDYNLGLVVISNEKDVRVILLDIEKENTSLNSYNDNPVVGIMEFSINYNLNIGESMLNAAKPGLGPKLFLNTLKIVKLYGLKCLAGSHNQTSKASDLWDYFYNYLGESDCETRFGKSGVSIDNLDGLDIILTDGLNYVLDKNLSVEYLQNSSSLFFYFRLLNKNEKLQEIRFGKYFYDPKLLWHALKNENLNHFDEKYFDEIVLEYLDI